MTRRWQPPRIASRLGASSTNRHICRRVSPSRSHAGRSRASVRYATKRAAASCQGWPSTLGFTSPRNCSGRVCSSRPRKPPIRRRSSPGASRTFRAGVPASRTSVASSRSTAATSTKLSAGSSKKRSEPLSVRRANFDLERAHWLARVRGEAFADEALASLAAAERYVESTHPPVLAGITRLGPARCWRGSATSTRRW